MWNVAYCYQSSITDLKLIFHLCSTGTVFCYQDDIIIQIHFMIPAKQDPGGDTFMFSLQVKTAICVQSWDL